MNRLALVIALAASTALGQTYVRPSKGTPLTPFGSAAVAPNVWPGQPTVSQANAILYISTPYDWSAFEALQMRVYGTGGGNNSVGQPCVEQVFQYSVINLGPFIKVQAFKAAGSPDFSLTVLDAAAGTGPYFVAQTTNAVFTTTKFTGCPIALQVVPLPFAQPTNSTSVKDSTIIPGGITNSSPMLIGGVDPVTGTAYTAAIDPVTRGFVTSGGGGGGWTPDGGFIGSVAVNNFPATQPISGAVSVSGSVAVNNFPGSQTVTGSVAITNFPAVQTVSGTVTVAALPTSYGTYCSLNSTYNSTSGGAGVIIGSRNANPDAPNNAVTAITHYVTHFKTASSPTTGLDTYAVCDSTAHTFTLQNIGVTDIICRVQGATDPTGTTPVYAGVGTTRTASQYSFVLKKGTAINDGNGQAITLDNLASGAPTNIICGPSSTDTTLPAACTGDTDTSANCWRIAITGKKLW